MAGIKEETASIKCGPCLFDGDTVEPKYFCVDCLEYLCTECIRDHRRNKLLREHKLLEEDDFPQDIEVFEEMKKLSYCNKHTDAEVDQYCPSHDVLICTYCLQNDHRLCIGLCHMSRVLEDVSIRKNVEQHINDLRSKCKANNTEMMQTLEEAQNDINIAQKGINDFIHILKHNVDILEKTLNESVENETQRLRLSEQRMSTLEKKVSYYTNLHTITSKYGTSNQNFALNFKVSKFLKELETDDSAKSIKDKQVQFRQPTYVEDLITMLHQFDVVLTRKDNEASELSSDEYELYEDAVEFIEPNTEEAAAQVEETLAAREMDPNKNLRSLKVMDDRIRLLKFESKHAEELKTCVVAVEIVSDGRILLLQQENTLKLYSQKLALTSKVQLQHKVKDMCVIEQNRNGAFTVAVCFNQSCKIVFLEYVWEFLEKHEINCSHSVVSISMYVHHLVALVERKSSKSSYEIQLLDISTGHVCYAFDEFKFSSSQYNCYGSIANISYPNRISTCKTTMKVFVADRNTVYRFNINDGECEHYTLYAVGQCDWNYAYKQNSFSELQHTRDVKCDSQGNMYAISYHGLFQFYDMVSRRCSMQTLIKHCGNVVSMAIDEVRNRIVVGYEFADRAHVFEYTLSPHT